MGELLLLHIHTHTDSYEIPSPCCCHCKRMKPAWDELGAEYSTSSSVLIGDVDCTTQAELCQQYGVQGYPTIKYFKDGNTEGQDYQHGRKLNDLRQFVEEELAEQCLVSDPETGKPSSVCSEKEVKFMNAMKERGADAIKTQLERPEGMVDQKMKAELKSWVVQRLRILKQLSE